MERLNLNEQKVIKSKEQVDNAISALKGILLGINIDDTINKVEINELQKWVGAHSKIIDRNPFHEFRTIIHHTISNKFPINETIEDLAWLCKKYESENHYYNILRTDLQTLKGICYGILADGIIEEDEIFNLNQWLKDNEQLRTYYPYDELRTIISSIVSDNRIEEEEKLILKAYFSHFVELNNPKIEKQIKLETAEIDITAHCTSDPVVDIPGSRFCVTGVLNKLTREEIINEIRKYGGIVTDTITRNTDYLIVGDNGNPAWAFSCYGRKVEDALNLRKQGHTITLIHEFSFAEMLDDMA